MKSPSTPELRDILDDITPKIDFALKEGPISDHLVNAELPMHLQRRNIICNPTSWLLSSALGRAGVYTTPHLRTKNLTYRNETIPTMHVVLKMSAIDNRLIDPTSQQYYRYVGLTPTSASEDPGLAGLYPDDRIAIIEPDNVDFQETFAESAHDIEKRLTDRGVEGGVLVGSTLDEKKSVYRQLWNVGSFKSMFPPNRELRRAIGQSAALIDRYELLI